MIDAEVNEELENLLDYIKRSRGFDFTGYKRSNLARRVLKRVEAVGVERYSEYLSYLEAQPEEFVALFNTILINVTSYFRDKPSWDFLAAEVLPRVLQTKRPDEQIRVWCPGCASGEETYTAAILLAETLGADGLRDRVKIYGTDVDDEALNEARQAAYSGRQMTEVPQALREKYFEPLNGRYVIGKECRRVVVFGRHDLVQDPPISRIDLLICRNTLMYFNAETQTKVLGRLHFALNNSGVLFLGRAEMLLTRAHLFSPIDVKHRVFAKVTRGAPVSRTAPPELTSGKVVAVESDPQHLRDLVYEVAPVPQVAVDAAGNVAAANERARALFGLSAADLGRPLRDLEMSYRPVDLRSLIDEAYSQKRPVSVVGAEWQRPNGQPHYVDVQVVPLPGEHDNLLGVGITFVDVSRLKQQQDEYLKARHELEAYSEELQAANEELETTNEELQSTNEELETTNEELQSANEELETINEELQSTNQEMEFVNRELQQMAAALNQVSAFRDSILSSLGVGVAVLDRELRVQMWNRRASDLWGVRDEEIRGQHFLNLDIGLPVADLTTSLRLCLGGGDNRHDMLLDAVDRRGRPMRCRVRCGPLAAEPGEIQGIILVMEPVQDERAP